MDRKLILSTIIIVMISQFLFAYSHFHRNKTDDTNTSKLVPLKDLQRPILITLQDIFQCRDHWCEKILAKSNRTKKSFVYEGVGGMQCKGWLEDCLYFDGMAGEFYRGKYCIAENHHLTWAKETGKRWTVEYGLKNGCSETPVPAPKVDHGNCHTCICKCIERENNASQEGSWAFSLRPSLSDSSEFKVVSGVRIRVNADRLIYLEISETDLDSEEEGTWRSSDTTKPMTEDTDYSIIVPENKSILLGEIFVPSDYVITGVRFSKTSSTLQGQNSAIQLEVRGTKFDKANSELDLKLEKWFDSRSSQPSAGRSSVPPGMKMMTIFRNTSDIQSDLDLLTIPLLSTRDIQVEGRPALVGMGLMCGNCDTDKEFIVPTVIAHMNHSKDTDAKGEIREHNDSLKGDLPDVGAIEEDLSKDEGDEEQPDGDQKKGSDSTQKQKKSGVGDIGSNEKLVVTLAVFLLCVVRFL